jgi:hypothetical protein
VHRKIIFTFAPVTQDSLVFKNKKVARKPTEIRESPAESKENDNKMKGNNK